MTKDKSSVLFISICSRTKRKGGTNVYLPSNVIGKSLEDKYYDALLKLRRILLHKLSEIHWHNVPIDELKMNQNLKEGPDFGGTEKGEYLPAIMRYSGRYYNALSQKIAFPYEILTTTHNFLILSGLYGLVTPSEPIQMYTCPVEIESENVQEYWRKNNRLTLILLNYIQENNIKRVFDLTSRSIYRDLINWTIIKKRSAVEVLHCFIDQAAGDPALSEFGSITGELLNMSEEDLLNIKPGSPISFDEGEMICHHLTIQPKGYPAEPIIGLPAGYETEDEILNMNNRLIFDVTSFELKMKEIIESKCSKHSQIWDNFDSKYKNKAIKEMKTYILDYPELEESDFSPIQFLILNDIQNIVVRNWDYFSDIFIDKENFENYFEAIRFLRNKLHHPNKERIPIPMIKQGEGSIEWFKGIFNRIERKNLI